MSRPVIRKAILPAAGMGTRLRPLTQLIPKEMLPVGDQVVLQRVYQECDAAGLDALLLVLNRDKLALTAVDAVTPPAAGCETARRVHYVEQRPLGGLAHAILQGEAFIGGDSFAVVLADTIITGETGGLLRRLMRVHAAAGAAVTLAAQKLPAELLSRYGVLQPAGVIGDPFAVAGVVEKPDPADAPSDYAIAGRYVFSAEIFAAIRALQPAAGAEPDLTEAITALAQAGRPVLAVPLADNESRLDIGNPQSYFAAFRQLSE